MKSDIFKKEISYINDKKYQVLAKEILELLPDYFYEVPASSTGKYHPEYTTGTGGLVRHTKSAVKIAHELMGNKSINGYNNREKDLTIISLLIHDGLKSGLEKSEYTKFEHPLLIGKYIEDNKQALELDEEDLQMIKEMTSSHMGEWNTNQYSNITLPLPVTKFQRFVHMCDYLASRKFLNVNFDLNNNIVE